jgi:OOP family OmpA-OmpF porin
MQGIALVLSRLRRVWAYYFAGKRDFARRANYNISLGWDFTQNWGVEGLYGHVSTHRTDDSSVDVGVKTYLLDAVYHFPLASRPTVEPLFLAGVGVINTDDPSSSDAHSHNNANVGAGVEFFLNESFALRADVRDIYTFAGGANDIMANLSIRFLLGKADTAATDASAEPMQMASSSNAATTQQAQLDVKFGTEKAGVTASHTQAIDGLGQYLQAHKQAKVDLQGYADTTGSDAYNQALSQRRADSVKAYIVKHYDVAATRIQTQGFGSADPVASNANTEGRAMNRRVVAVINQSETQSQA